MANPLMSNGPHNNLFQSFQQFKSNFQGDPKAKVQELLASGRMTQDQFNYLQQIASQFSQMFH